MTALISGIIFLFSSLLISPINISVPTVEIKNQSFNSSTNAEEYISNFQKNNKIPTIPARKEIKIAVIDQGYNTDINNIENYIYNPKNIKNFLGYDFTRTSLRDRSDHGTSVIGIILGVNPNAKILPIKYDSPSIDETDAESLKKEVHSLRIAIESGVDIIHLSLAGNGASYEEEMLLKEAQRKGIIIVTAMGNNGMNFDNGKKVFPAAYNLENQVSVSNYDIRKGKISRNSNRSFTMDTISYNGVSIESFDTVKSGTSQAAPFITGAISLILANSDGLTGEQIKQILEECSDKGQQYQSKYGLFNFNKLAEKVVQERDIQVAQQ